MFTYDDGIAIIMPYFSCGDLGRIAPRLSAFQLKEAIRQILHALQYLHERGYIHRDLKPNNVLIRQEEPLEIVVADFGSVSFGNPTTIGGTTGYQAPEIHTVHETETPAPYTNVVDIYALGVLLLKCLGVQETPALVQHEESHHRNVASMMSRELDGCDDLERRGGLLLAGSMLTFQAEVRPSADECLQNTWLSPWSYVPWFAVPPDLIGTPSFTLESRPANNPIKAIALGLAIQDDREIGRRRAEYLAYILAKYTTFNQTGRVIEGPPQEKAIAEILLSLPRAVHVNTSTDFPNQKDHIFESVCQYLALINGPANKRLKVKLASILAKYPIPRSFDTHGGAQTQIRGPKQIECTSTEAVAGRSPGHHIMILEVSERPGKPRKRTPEQRRTARSSTRRKSSEDPQLNTAGSIKDRLRPRKNQSSTNDAARDPTSDRMELCTRSKPSRKKSGRVGKFPSSDRMELCSQ